MKIEVIKAPYLSGEGECWINKKHPIDKKRKFGQCCCICRFHLIDYWYCQRMPKELKQKDHCGCEQIRGYICVAGELHGEISGQSGWPHHSIGCECFQQKSKRQQEQKKGAGGEVREQDFP